MFYGFDRGKFGKSPFFTIWENIIGTFSQHPTSKSKFSK